MKTDIIHVTSREEGVGEALALTEAQGGQAGLEGRQLLHLRLLSEELIGMLRGIAGEAEADYWLEREDRSFLLHLASEVRMTEPVREQLLAASTTGRNDAVRGFMGSLRVFIAETMLYAGSSSPALSGMRLGLMGMTTPTMPASDSYLWSLRAYRDHVRDLRDADEGSDEDWDRLEQSIVANIADDVSVRIVGSRVEIIVAKQF